MVFTVVESESAVTQILKPKLPCLFSQKKSVIIKLLSDSLIGLTVLEVSSSSFLPSLSDPPRLETQTVTTSGFFSL